MRPRREYGAVAAFSFVAAALTALSDYALGFQTDLGALSLRAGAAFFIALILLAGWRALWASQASESHARPEQDEQRLLTPPADSDASAALHPKVLKRLGEEISACNPIIHTLCDHMQTVVTNTEDVAMNIMTKLIKVDETITELISFLRVSSRDKILPIIEQTETRLHINNRILAEYLTLRIADMETGRGQLSCIADLTRQLDLIVQSVRKVARQTNMLALNATIEAARAGVPGRSFAVVAGEVKALSQQTDQAAKDIGDGLQTLKGAIAESAETLTAQQERERKELDAIAAAMSDHERNMSALIQQQRDTLGTMRGESEKIALLVIDLIGSIQFQDVARQKLDGVTGVLHQIVDHSASLEMVIQSDNLDEGAVETVLAGIKTKRQETIDKSRLSHIDNSENKLIELF